MQKYVDAFAARNQSDYEKAEAACKATRAKIKEAEKGATAVAARILGVPESEVTTSESRYDGRYTKVKRWPGVSVNLSESQAWKKHGQAIADLNNELRRCCDDEQRAKGRNGDKSMNAFRRFVSARYGRNPTAPAKQVVDAYLASIEPVACAVR